MKLIAHRGLLNGPDVNLENRPEQIELALRRGFDCEIDLRVIDSEFYLGHDGPDYPIDKKFLDKPGLWIHAKNWQALAWLSDTQLNYFWHEEDCYTLTSHGIVWTYPNNMLMARSVCVMPENQEVGLERASKLPIYGVCSDYIETILSK